MNDDNTDEFCVAGAPDCAERFILAGNTPSAISTIQQLFNDLDELVDGSDGALAGKVRYNTYQDDYIMYKGRMRKR